jgi:hypothetical protein
MTERERARTLDDEGMPDLEGPLPQKEATGDPQEGLAPPAEVPASLDYGTTAREEHEREPIERRLAREQPDVDDAPVGDGDRRAPQLVEEDEGARTDADADLAATDVDRGLGGASAEEEAVKVTDEAPGATEDDDPGYLDREK